MGGRHSRWRLRPCGDVVADTGEEYASKGGAREAVESVQANDFDAAVEEQ